MTKLNIRRSWIRTTEYLREQVRITEERSRRATEERFRRAMAAPHRRATGIRWTLPAATEANSVRECRRATAEECRRATRACGEREDRELKKLREKEEELRGLEERLGTLAGGSIRVDADKGVLGNYQQFSSVAAAINSQGKKPDLY